MMPVNTNWLDSLTELECVLYDIDKAKIEEWRQAARKVMNSNKAKLKDSAMPQITFRTKGLT